MGSEYAGGIHVIVATKDDKTEYWAAAFPKSRSLEEVRKLVAPGWRLTLTDKRLTRQQAAELNMRAYSVRQLKFVP
jgi:hypothetical protein